VKEETIVFYGLSDMGRQRTNNEDAFVAERMDRHSVLAVAIDGVGGYEGGEVAAAIAQEEIPAYLKEFNKGDQLELLKRAVVAANNAIVDRRQTDPERANMSCVLTSALINTQQKVLDMVHVGDSRLYQFHHGVLTKLSHDHSLVGYREEIGDLTEEEAMHHPQRNIISRDVGSEHHEVSDHDFLEAEEFPLLPNSIFLLCSDGLTDLITSKQITAVLQQSATLEEKAQQLVNAANEAGGKDNITVVLVEYRAEETDEKPHTENSKPEEITLIAGEPCIRKEIKKPRKCRNLWQKRRNLLSLSVSAISLITIITLLILQSSKTHVYLLYPAAVTLLLIACICPIWLISYDWKFIFMHQKNSRKFWCVTSLHFLLIAFLLVSNCIKPDLYTEILSTCIYAEAILCLYQIAVFVMAPAIKFHRSGHATFLKRMKVLGRALTYILSQAIIFCTAAYLYLHKHGQMREAMRQTCQGNSGWDKIVTQYWGFFILLSISIILCTFSMNIAKIELEKMTEDGE